MIIKKTGKFSGIMTCEECGINFETSSVYEKAKSKCGIICHTCLHQFDNISLCKKVLNKLFTYSSITGELRYKVSGRRRIKGEIATRSKCDNRDGGYSYLVVSINGKQYLAHRIIWMMKTGVWPVQIDHDDHNRMNNKWNNIFDVSNQINHQNRSLNKNNSTGFIGVSKIRATGRFRAYVVENGKQKHVGVFGAKEEASKAVKLAYDKIGFHKNHGDSNDIIGKARTSK